MSRPYGKFTVRGSGAVEDLITGLVNETVDMAKRVLSPNDYRALIMMGGYGRGEGGVEIVGGEERPHNNFDFLLISESARPSKQAVLRQRLYDIFTPVMQKYDIEIDLSVISTWKLRFSPTLIIWYETRFGHKTILGDDRFVPGLKHFRLNRIPSRDALRLLVNRGTLLLINEQLLEEGCTTEADRKRVVRNVMKAIIGYGDAMLFFLGDYHWSYVERKRRMEQRHDIPAEFRALYDEAAEFRFRPCYEKYRDRDLKEWLKDLKVILEPLHLFCEEKRLGVQKLNWNNYPTLALSQALFDEPWSCRSWVRKGLNLARSVPGPLEHGAQGNLGYRVLGQRGLYPLIYPVVAYSITEPQFRFLATGVLNSRDTRETTLREAYLRTWGRDADINTKSPLRLWTMPVPQETEEVLVFPDFEKRR